MTEKFVEYNGYIVSNKGYVISKRGRTLKVNKHKNGYLSVLLYLNKKPIRTYIHILVAKLFLDYKYGYIIHKNKNLNDNTHLNLKITTKRKCIINGKGCLYKKDKQSKYIGVCWNKRRQCWRSKIKINGKIIYLGDTKDEKYAGLLYTFALDALDQFENPKQFIQLLKNRIHLEVYM